MQKVKYYVFIIRGKLIISLVDTVITRDKVKRLGYTTDELTAWPKRLNTGRLIYK
jgi:hypothetical protein